MKYRMDVAEPLNRVKTIGQGESSCFHLAL